VSEDHLVKVQERTEEKLETALSRNFAIKGKRGKWGIADLVRRKKIYYVFSYHASRIMIK
jgi:hypothetical protein